MCIGAVESSFSLSTNFIIQNIKDFTSDRFCFPLSIADRVRNKKKWNEESSFKHYTDYLFDRRVKQSNSGSLLDIINHRPCEVTAFQLFRAANTDGKIYEPV